MLKTMQFHYHKMMEVNKKRVTFPNYNHEIKQPDYGGAPPTEDHSLSIVISICPKQWNW